MKGNKPDIFLALTLRRFCRARKPICFKLANNTYSSNPIKILALFRKHLIDLYSAKNISDETRATALFSNLPLTILSTSQHTTLEQPISELEVCTAIKTLKTNKRPGPDGFTAAYYKQFADFLTPLLVGALNSILKGHSFRPDSLSAIISMLPKPQTHLGIITAPSHY